MGDEDDSDDSAKAKEKKKEKKEKKDKKDKKEKKKDKKKKDKDDDDDDDDEDDAKKEKKKEKKEKKDKKDKKDKKEKKKDKKKEQEDADDDDDDDSAAGDAAKNEDDLVFTDEVIKESVARVKKLIQEAEGKGKPMGTEKFFDEVRMIQIQNSFSTKLRMYVVLEGCFGDDMLPAKVKAKLPYLKKMASTPKMAASEILYAFEVYYVENPKNLKQYPMCLKELYSADLVSESDLNGHYGKSLETEGFAEAKAAAKPFLDWLTQEGQ